MRGSGCGTDVTGFSCLCAYGPLLALCLLTSCSASRPLRDQLEPQAQPVDPPGELPAEPQTVPAATDAPQVLTPADAAVAPVADVRLQQDGRGSALLHPNVTDSIAPERFTVELQTTAGDLHLDVRRGWAPHSADRFYTLVKLGYFDGLAFFRVVPGFVAQIGIHSDPAVERVWRNRRIPDDPVLQTNNRGMVSFVPNGKRGRATQLVINLGDNAKLDRQGFAPLGRIREIELAQGLFSGYGEVSPMGRGPSPNRIQREGRNYLEAQFGNLDYLKRALVIDEKPLRAAITP